MQPITNTNTNTISRNQAGTRQMKARGSPLAAARKNGSSGPHSPRHSRSPPPPKPRNLGCLHVCIALVAVLAGVLLALGVNERVNGGGAPALGDGDAPRLGSGQ